MAKYGLDYVASIKKIEAAVPLMTQIDPIKEDKLENVFDFTPAPFRESEDYWARYKIPLEIAAKFSFLAKNVYKNETFYARSTKANPIFIYKFVSGHIKIYRPLAEKGKK
jgi:hypothetical protein